MGYVNQDDLDEGVIKDYYKQFSTDDLISDSTSLIDLLKVFKNRGYVFILEKNEVKQIVTMADLHKEPMRLLAFSLVSLLEINLTSIIVKIYPDDNWVQHLTEGRIKAAKTHLMNFRRKMKP